MSKATFDLFDAPLGDAFDYLQALPDEVRFPCYRQEFSVDPRNWAANEPPTWAQALNWQEYRYSDVQDRTDLDTLITDDHPGIYIFYARPEILLHSFPRFAFYVGISGEGNSMRPLRERLKDYLPRCLSQIQKRKNIHRMLQLYYNRLWVSYALTDTHAAHLEELELKLHGYVHPCFGRRDFPLEIKHQQQAFGQI
jgi:hypothetical protein